MIFPEQVFIDANIPMYMAGGDHPHRAACDRVMVLIEQGRLDAITDAEVHQEILHRYLSLRRPGQAVRVSEILEATVPITLPITLADVARARELPQRYPSLRARDLIHLAVMLNNGIHTVVSVDRDFDGIEGVTRLDPAAL